MCVKLGCAKFQPSSAGRIFLNLWLNEGGASFGGKLAISRKRREIRLRLQLITNRKWHTRCQTRWKSLTLDDLEGHWQPVRSAILATAGLFVL